MKETEPDQQECPGQRGGEGGHLAGAAGLHTGHQSDRSSAEQRQRNRLPVQRRLDEMQRFLGEGRMKFGEGRHHDPH